MIYDKTCGDVRLSVFPNGTVTIQRLDQGEIKEGVSHFVAEDLRDLRHLIDAALRAAKA